MNLPKLNLSFAQNQEEEICSKIDLEDSQTKQMSILFEYKLLQLYGSLLGIYVIPQIDNIYVWHSIMFLRHGFYKDAKFKFVVDFSQQFPVTRPRIRFVGKVYHPLISLQTGDVDMQTLIPNWNYMEGEMMYTVLKNLNNMFLDKTKLSCRSSFNSSAGLLYCSSTHQFMQKVIDSIQKSQLSMAENDHDSSMIVNYCNLSERDCIKVQLNRICAEQGDFQIKKQKMMQFILNMS